MSAKLSFPLCNSVAVAACLLGILAGCPSAPSPIDGGTIGVTPGGTEDMARARSSIERGWFPDPESITVEGFLSEHDIPITPPENAPEIYGAIATAWRKPYGATIPYADVFVSIGTTIDVSSFKRRPQNLCVAVDRSGSMRSSASASEYRTKLETVQQAMYALIDRLEPEDQLAIVSFNDKPRVDARATAGDEKEKLAARVAAWTAEGNTDLFSAMQLAFETALGAASADRDSRVIVLTDALPTEGPATSSEFLAMQRTYAEQGIGFTLMGVGVEYGQELARDIAQVRGGNAFYLADAERVRQIFEEEFDYFVTPAAYDLRLQLNVAPGIGIRDVYGVADYTPGQLGAIVDVPTLFFSPREGGGAIVVRLTFESAPTFATAASLGTAYMRYELRDGTVRELSQDLTLPAGLSPSGDPAWYSEPTTRRAAFLLDTALVFESAAQAAWDGRYADSAATLRGFLANFDAATAGMSDRLDSTERSLSDERALLQRFLGMVD